MYFETDPHLTRELILAFGERLRTDFYENLPGFVDAIELTDKMGFYEMHSDFLSRLGMTFTHGDYARIEAIKEKDGIAESLYERSLDYHPDHRAYLGLGIIRQKNGEYEGSVRLLSEGIRCFPHSEPLNICLGISYMNLGEYEKALPYFLKFQDSKDAVYHIAGCYSALGAFEKESDFLRKFQALP